MLLQTRADRRRRGWHQAWRWVGLAVLALCIAHVTLAIMVWRHASERIAHPPTVAADAALVLGNRAYLNGQPNPCMTNRVDKGVEFARAVWRACW